MEIPQARADILTASLRANPILYADSQLIPYGRFSDRRPGGPTQYDLNVSHPLDFSHKRRARTDYAARAHEVTEAQYQDAVRLEINNLYTAFVDVLAARQTVRYARASVKGLERLLRATRLLYEKDIGVTSDVNQVRPSRRSPRSGVLDAEENLRRAKRTLGMMLGPPARPRPRRSRSGGRSRIAARRRRRSTSWSGWRSRAGPTSWPTGSACRSRESGRPAGAWPTATRTPTCSTSPTRSRTTPRSASKARRPGPWA